MTRRDRQAAGIAKDRGRTPRRDAQGIRPSTHGIYRETGGRNDQLKQVPTLSGEPRPKRIKPTVDVVDGVAEVICL